MKKLAIAVLLVVAACSRRHAVTGVSGASGAREAVAVFLAAAKNQDLDAFGRAWGTAQGPALETWSRDEREKREIIMMGCLRHDRFQILSETPAMSGERVMMVELRFKDLTASSNFSVVQGPKGRWYVQQLELKDFQSICVAK